MQSRLSYEYYQPIENRLNSSYTTGSNRSYQKINLPYASSAYGVYRRLPAQVKAPPFLHRSRNNDTYSERTGHVNPSKRDSSDIFNYTFHHYHPNVSLRPNTLRSLSGYA